MTIEKKKKNRSDHPQPLCSPINKTLNRGQRFKKINQWLCLPQYWLTFTFHMPSNWLTNFVLYSIFASPSSANVSGPDFRRFDRLNPKEQYRGVTPKSQDDLGHFTAKYEASHPYANYRATSCSDIPNTRIYFPLIIFEGFTSLRSYSKNTVLHSPQPKTVGSWRQRFTPKLK